MHRVRSAARPRLGRSAAIVVLLLLIVVAAVVAVRWSSRRTTRATTITTSQGATAPRDAARVDGLPVMARKPTPVSPGFAGCPAVGDGGDPQLNRLKNRIDSATWIPVAFDDVLRVSWPKGVARRPTRRFWTSADARAVARYEGLPISIEGYVVAARQSGPESTNCHGASSRFRDWHVWLAGAPGGPSARRRAIIVEPTPSTRSTHPGWSLAILHRLARDSTRVRVSGWLMLDPEHPEEVGKTRGTIWEIHPVMRIDAQRGNEWVDVASARR